MALVLVLWLITGLSALALPAAQQAGSGNVRLALAAEAVRLDAALDSALTWAATRIRRGELGIGESGRFTLDDLTVQVQVEGESARLDLNRASGPEIAAWLRARGIDAARAAALRDAILDWRDRDRLRRLHGAEKTDYEALGLPDRPADGPFRHPVELRLVAGMDRELFQRLWPGITVFAPTTGPRRAESAAAERSGAQRPSPGRDAGDVYRLHLRVQSRSGAERRAMAIVRLSGSGFELLDWLQPPLGEIPS